MTIFTAELKESEGASTLPACTIKVIGFRRVKKKGPSDATLERLGELFVHFAEPFGHRATERVVHGTIGCVLRGRA